MLLGPLDDVGKRDLWTVELYTDINHNSKDKYNSDAGKSDCPSKEEFFLKSREIFEKWKNFSSWL